MSSGSSDGYWIGLYRDVASTSKDGWKWTDTDNTYGDFLKDKWTANEPSGMSGEVCVRIRSGELRDSTCRTTRFYYICRTCKS